MLLSSYTPYLLNSSQLLPIPPASLIQCQEFTRSFDFPITPAFSVYLLKFSRKQLWVVSLNPPAPDGSLTLRCSACLDCLGSEPGCSAPGHHSDANDNKCLKICVLIPLLLNVMVTADSEFKSDQRIAGNSLCIVGFGLIYIT